MENLQLLPNLRELFLIGNPCCGVADAVRTEERIQILEDDDGVELPQDRTERSRDKEASTGWSRLRMYIIAMLPGLRQFDGKEISRSERIIALQQLPKLSSELKKLLEQCGKIKELKCRKGHLSSNGSEKVEVTEHSPEARAEISRDTAQQKALKDQQQRANQPRVSGEREWEEDHQQAVQKATKRIENGEIRQKNGKCSYQHGQPLHRRQ